MSEEEAAASVREEGEAAMQNIVSVKRQMHLVVLPKSLCSLRLTL